jgi:hemerythrin superfamily protein
MSDTRPGGSTDPLEFLAHQHRDVEQRWIQLEAAHEGDQDMQSQLADELVSMLLQHDAIETELLYPALREHGGEQGEQLAEHALEEHAKVREQLQQIEGQDPQDEQIWSVLSQCIDDVTHHVEEEETIIFPLLRENWDVDQRIEVCGRLSEIVAAGPATG